MCRYALPGWCDRLRFVKRTVEVGAPDGERYIVTMRRWNGIGIGPVAWLALFVRWAWRFGRWTVEVNRRVPASEYTGQLLPYAFHWHGPRLSEEQAEVEFDRVAAAIRAGQWPDPAYHS